MKTEKIYLAKDTFLEVSAAEYLERVEEAEFIGIDRSDAQAVVDAYYINKHREKIRALYIKNKELFDRAWALIRVLSERRYPGYKPAMESLATLSGGGGDKRDVIIVSGIIFEAIWSESNAEFLERATGFSKHKIIDDMNVLLSVNDV